MSDKHEPSERLLDLIFAALNVGIDTVRATNGGMHPFLLTPGDDKPAMMRFFAESMEESIRAAQEAAGRVPPETPAYAIAFDGYLRDGDRKFDAIFVEAAERGGAIGFLFAQQYQPANEEREFARVGRPALIQQVPSLFPPADKDVEEGEEAGKDPHRSMVLFHAPDFDLESAAQTLRPCGLEVTRAGDVLSVRRKREGKRPVLYLHLDRGENVRKLAATLSQGTEFASLLAGCDSVFKISFDDLDDVLDEINTLIDVQGYLEEATGGVICNTWNGSIWKPSLG